MSADLKKLVAITALNDMFKKGRFDICAIRELARMLNVVPPAEPMNLLTPLHMISFSDMPPEIRNAIPELIRLCLDVEPTFQFEMPVPARATVERVIEHMPPKEGAFLRRLLGGKS